MFALPPACPLDPLTFGAAECLLTLSLGGADPRSGGDDATPPLVRNARIPPSHERIVTFRYHELPLSLKVLQRFDSNMHLEGLSNGVGFRVLAKQPGKGGEWCLLADVVDEEVGRVLVSAAVLDKTLRATPFAAARWIRDVAADPALLREWLFTRKVRP